MRFRSHFFSDSLRARALRGSFLTIGNVAGQNVLRLAGNLALTRILFPEAFGVMALVQVVMTAVSMFSDFGLRSSIVQNPRGTDPVFLNTAWTMQIGRGCLLCLAILLLSDPMAEFYGEPLLGDLLKLTALAPVIQGLSSTRIATASREITLERLVLLRLGAQVCGLISMICLALWLRSAWALAIGSLVSAGVLTSLSHVVLPGIRNRLQFEKAAALELFSFGKYVFLATLAGFFLNQGDRAVLGKFVSLEELAIYNIGVFLASAPLLLAFAVNRQVLFPLYARRPPKESAENRRKLSKARMLMTGGLLAVTGVLALIGDPLVRFLYDPRYEAAGPILVLVALATLPRLVSLSYENIPMAAGHSGRYAFFVITRAVIQMSLMIYTVQLYGLVGAVIAPIFAWALTYPLQIYLIRIYHGWDPRHDALFFALVLPIAALVLWVHGPVLMPLFAGI